MTIYALFHFVRLVCRAKRMKVKFVFVEYSFGNLVSEEKLQDHANEIHVTLTGLSIMAVYCAVSAFAGIWIGMIVIVSVDVGDIIFAKYSNCQCR